ncbi:MAG: (d)CMP kinase [Clostridia bacterium]|nr:(d)CMP kinase [Clostridia bacterium]
MGYNIAIDGPSGAGKSSLSRAAAEEIGFMYIDTGALYRTIGLYVYRNKISAEDESAVASALSDININIKFVDGCQHVFLNGSDVSEDIRIHEVSDYTSKVSAFACVREFLLRTQRELAEKYDVIMDGRDIGSVVLPDAELKIYLTASAEERAKRRFDELAAKGQDVKYETVLHDVIERDFRDMNRKTAPLKVADGAVVVDTTGNTFKQSLKELTDIIKEKLK